MRDEQQEKISYRDLYQLHFPCCLYLLFTLTCKGAFLGLVVLHVASSPLGDVCSCAITGKVNLFGRRRSRQAAKDPFLKRCRQERAHREALRQAWVVLIDFSSLYIDLHMSGG